MLDLKKVDVVVYDLEIKEEIGKNGIGWKDYDKMGISVGCCYSFLKKEYKVFLDDNIEELGEQLDKAELAVGFNIFGFDDPLLEATLKRPIKKDHHYDMLWHSRKSHGGGDFVKGFKLDNHLAGTFGIEFMKTGNGADAPVWYKQGKLGKVISYCLDDVKREAMLFQYIWNTGKVILDSFGEVPIKITPQEFLMAIRS